MKQCVPIFYEALLGLMLSLSVTVHISQAAEPSSRWEKYLRDRQVNSEPADEPLEPWERYLRDHPVQSNSDFQPTTPDNESTEGTQPIEDKNRVVWLFNTATKSVFYVKASEQNLDSKGVHAWMHGAHKEDETVEYRVSIWRVNLDCAGYYRVSAGTTWGADGRTLSNWDAYGEIKLIRPNTMYADLEKSLCSGG